MELSVFHSIVLYIHQHPHIGGLITFFVAFTESLAIIGSVIPGSLTMTAIGMLIGSGVMPFTSTLIWAVFGAFCGDYLSYWIGSHYNERLIRMWPFRKYPHWIERGKSFFHKHGGKSVVIGRFVGPVRSAIPLIAGLMHMRKRRFILAALPSALLWSFVYMAPGIIVGAMSLALPPAAATKFILIMLGIVAFSWIFFILIHLFFKATARLIDRGSAKLWDSLAKGRKTHYFTDTLSRPNHINPHRQLLLLFSVIACLGLFAFTFYCEVHNVHLAKLNQPLYELFRSLRTRHLDQFMLAFTVLGDKHVMLGMAILMFVWLAWRRYIWAALNWAGLVVLSGGLGEVLKTFYFSPRPGGLLNSQVTSSFPSGHTILSVTLLGFLALLIAEHSESYQRKLTFFVSFLLITLISLSRLYLGAHWLTDVLASLFLGLSLLCLVILSYRRMVSRVIPCGTLSFVASSILLILWSGYAVLKFHSFEEDYTLYWPKVTIDSDSWWKHDTHEIPYFVASRLGKPAAVMNVQWLGSLDSIKKEFSKHGWQKQELDTNIKSTLYRLSPTKNPTHLPLLPTLYQNQAPVLLFTKTDKNKKQLHFMLWRSSITLSDRQQPLWLGSISYFVPRPENINITPDEKREMYKSAIEQFSTWKGLDWKTITIPQGEIPAVMEPLNWDGTIALIKSL